MHLLNAARPRIFGGLEIPSKFKTNPNSTRYWTYEPNVNFLSERDLEEVHTSLNRQPLKVWRTKEKLEISLPSHLLEALPLPAMRKGVYNQRSENNAEMINNESKSAANLKHEEEAWVQYKLEELNEVETVQIVYGKLRTRV